MISTNDFKFNQAETRLRQALDRLRPVIINTGNGHKITHKSITTFIPFSAPITSTRR
jgi:hypothetical protein